MAVIYREPIPDINPKLSDFVKHGVVPSFFVKWRQYDTGAGMFRCGFKSNGLYGEIRTTCYGNSLAVDVEWDAFHGKSCLTTECRTVREAKAILFTWFRGQGFSLKEIKHKPNLAVHGHQLRLSPFLFRY